MIETLWQQHGQTLLLTWALLATVWLWAMPRENIRWIDRAYPVLPLAVAAVAASGQLAPGFLSNFLQLGLWLWLWLTVVWVISLIKRDASIMDIAYGLLLLAAPWWVHQHLGADGQDSHLLLLAMTTVGFGRYSLYILWRNLPHGEDPRYARWRQRSGARFWWWSYFQVFLLQGVVIWVWAIPLLFGMTSPGPIGFWHVAGALVWGVGFVFEAGADWQLTRFKRLRTDRSQLLNTGLWALTRHPNYFGQTCMWWGYGVFALSHPWGWLSIFPLAYVTWFMNKGSATSLMERHMAKSKPGYAEYCANVPAFFPRLPVKTSQPKDNA
jgi:steroid 5-alpha reductase family enzyme